MGSTPGKHEICLGKLTGTDPIVTPMADRMGVLEMSDPVEALDEAPERLTLSGEPPCSSPSRRGIA